MPQSCQHLRKNFVRTVRWSRLDALDYNTSTSKRRRARRGKKLTSKRGLNGESEGKGWVNKAFTFYTVRSKLPENQSRDKGALSPYCKITLIHKTCLRINGNPKVMVWFCYQSGLHYCACIETGYWCLLLQMARMEMD